MSLLSIAKLLELFSYFYELRRLKFSLFSREMKSRMKKISANDVVDGRINHAPGEFSN